MNQTKEAKACAAELDSYQLVPLFYWRDPITAMCVHQSVLYLGTASQLVRCTFISSSSRKHKESSLPKMVFKCDLDCTAQLTVFHQPSSKRSQRAVTTPIKVSMIEVLACVGLVFVLCGDVLAQYEWKSLQFKQRLLRQRRSVSAFTARESSENLFLCFTEQRRLFVAKRPLSDIKKHATQPSPIAASWEPFIQHELFIPEPAIGLHWLSRRRVGVQFPKIISVINIDDATVSTVAKSKDASSSTAPSALLRSAGPNAVLVGVNRHGTQLGYMSATRGFVL
jgi:hypothetical protein